VCHVRNDAGASPLPVRPGRGHARALQAIREAGQEPAALLARHVVGDWGELDQEDERENQYSLVHGFRLLSAYTLASGEKIWIITEADRSSTTLLLPAEY